ncbi:MAG: hypothetical protein H0X25_15060 [Acidobacteriales bacterium]|nr:hypothetical protein [Terriglobales bacterium]
MNKPLALDDASFSTQPISTVQADAYRADLLAYVQREKDARTLLEQILRDDPNNTLAHETMGYLEFRAGHLEQAQNWYEQAVKLDSQSYLAQYYYASMALSSGRPSAQLDRQIEDSLLKAIKLNPAFAGSYAQLAVFYAMRHKNLSQAHMLSLQAIQLEPANVHFRVYGARVLLEMERGSDALPVLQAALKLAKTPEEVSAVQNEMQALQYALSVMEHNRKQARDFREEMEAAKRDPAAEPHLRRQPSADGGTPEVETAQDQSEDSLTGPHHSASGIVRNVRCSPPAVIDADLVTGSKTITLHTRNFYKIQFSALGYTPAGDFQPCTELEGRQVKIEYIESATNKLNGLVAVELHK